MVALSQGSQGRPEVPQEVRARAEKIGNVGTDAGPKTRRPVGARKAMDKHVFALLRLGAADRSPEAAICLCVAKISCRGMGSGGRLRLRQSDTQPICGIAND